MMNMFCPSRKLSHANSVNGLSSEGSRAFQENQISKEKVAYNVLKKAPVLFEHAFQRASLPAVIVAGLLRVSGASIFWFVFVAIDTTK